MTTMNDEDKKYQKTSKTNLKKKMSTHVKAKTFRIA